MTNAVTKTDNNIWNDFHDVVNMSAKSLEKWLTSKESKSVGWVNEGESEAVGHKSGERIVEILEKKKSELSDDDVKHMHKVVGYVHRHMAQKPKGDISDTNWRYSLMNWGHDPMKE